MNRSCIYQAFTMAFVRQYLYSPFTPVVSHTFLCVAVHFLCIIIGLFRKLFVHTVRSCAFSMSPNRPLSENLPIPCVINGLNRPFLDICLPYEFAMSELPCLYQEFVIAQSRPQLDVSYSYELELAWPIISIVSPQIGNLIPYYFYHKSLICHLNAIFY